MPKIYAKESAGAVVDVFLSEKTTFKNPSAIGRFIDGNIVKNYAGVNMPVLRYSGLTIGARVIGSTMEIVWGSNHTTFANAKIVVIGSSHAVSFPFQEGDPRRLDVKLRAKWPSATIINLGVAGLYSNQLMPTNLGGDATVNITKALTYNPDFVIYVAPTNDAQYNTPAQTVTNQLAIEDACKKGGAEFFIHSPVPRTPYNATQQQNLLDTHILSKEAFKYRYINVWETAVFGSPIANGNPAFFQEDGFHFNDPGTTVQADQVDKTVSRELRPNTAYLQFQVQKSADGSTGWADFDIITDQQVVRKTYALSAGYYRVRAQFKDNSFSAWSQAVQVTAPPTAQFVRFNFNATAQNISGWQDVSGNPNSAIVTATSSGITISTVGTGTALWNPFGGTTANNNNGSDGLNPTNPTFVYPAEVIRSYFFNYLVSHTVGAYNLLLSGFAAGEIITYIDVIGSRDSTIGAGIPAATRLMDWWIIDGNGERSITGYDVKDRQTNPARFENVKADANGQVKMGIYRNAPDSPTHELAYINAMEIKRNI